MIMTAVIGVAVVAVFAFFNYDVRSALMSLQRDTPGNRVDSFMTAVIQGDERAAFAAWQIPTNGHGPTIASLAERRAYVTRSLIARRPRTYVIESVEWWSMCCEPHIIDSSRLASGARYTVDVDGVRYRIDAFAARTEAVYDGLPPSDWAVRDVYPLGERPIYNRWPGSLRSRSRYL